MSGEVAQALRHQLLPLMDASPERNQVVKHATELLMSETGQIPEELKETGWAPNLRGNHARQGSWVFFAQKPRQDTS